MSVKNLLFGPLVTGRGAVGLLVLRLVAGLAMMLHGWGKIQPNPFGWMGPDAPVPGFLQFLAALSEFGGGLALIVGLLTPIASLGIFFTMVVAVLVHVQRGDPFVAMKPGGGSFEPALGYLAIALLMIFTGPGALSLDALVFKLNKSDNTQKDRQL